MPILVVTGGPQNVASPQIDTSVPTFQTMVDAISDDIDDTQGEYIEQIQKAIFASVRYCERDVYYFNETRDVTFQTVEGQEWYGEADNPNIASLVRVQDLYLESDTIERRWLRRVFNEEIEILADNTAERGEPYAWTYFAQKIRLYPIPGESIYTVRLQLGPYRLNQITSTDDTNAWFTEAFDLVKARAKYILAKDTLKDAAVAAEALNDYTDQQSSLKAETSRRSATGQICVTCW